MLRRIIAIALLAGAAVPACNAGVPGFCGVSDDVRVAVANVPPTQYPAESAKHVQELRDAASGLSGEQRTLATRVADLLSAASEDAPGSLAFTNHYNDFVRASNTFDHRYCNRTEAP
ncbi:MAG: hypothetical protein ACJ77A_18350 [Actinomycetota bacterium]